MVKFLAWGNNGSLWWGSKPQLTDYESDVLPTVPRHRQSEVEKSMIDLTMSVQLDAHQHTFVLPFLFSHSHYNFLNWTNPVWLQYELHVQVGIVSETYYSYRYIQSYCDDNIPPNYNFQLTQNPGSSTWGSWFCPSHPVWSPVSCPSPVHASQFSSTYKTKV